MDFDQLVTFLEVVKLGNFSRAGQKVLRSQSAVSAQIRQLEEEYGERLLDRSGKIVRLTPAGEVFFEYVERILTLKRESIRAVADQGDRPRGVLAIGANEATCLYVLPDVFAKFSKLYPEVQISVYRNFSRKILERVNDGSIDVGVVTLPAKAPGVKVRSIFRDRLMLMVDPNNPLAGQKSVTVATAIQQPLIMPKTGYTRQIMDKLFRPYQSQLQVRMELPSVGMIKRFVAAGLGVSLISASFAEEDVRAGTASLVALQGVDLWRELGVVYQGNRTLPNSAKAFLDLILPQAKSKAHL
jgi:DNA-binding transcriptional LysR family regulator